MQTDLRRWMTLCEAKQVFYHSSSYALRDGTVLVPNVEQRISVAVEQVLERNRPPHAISRFAAVFMVDDIFMLAGTGAPLAYVYEVQPLGHVQRHDADWLIHISQQPERADEFADDYWKGEAAGSDPQWEYLTPKARIIRLAFDYDEDTGGFEPQ